jgi:very-short-patch-repair endonuclease
VERSTEALIHDLARRQHGVVTRAQLLGAGLTARVVWRRLEQQRLRPIHRGVYLVGPLNAPHSREMAAVLACGPGAVVSHMTAAALWDVVPRPSPVTPVDVLVPGRWCGHRPGVQVRRVRRLGPGEVTRWNGIPVTAPARTLLDLAADLGREGRSREMEQAVARAERGGLVTGPELRALVARYPRRMGVRLLRGVVEGHVGPVLTRSEAEERLLALIRGGRLPEPEVNVVVAGHEVDFLWAEERLVVEVDGYEFHSSKSCFEADRRRDAELSAAGFRVLRVTWRRITAERDAVLALIARTLGQGRRL